MAENIQTQEVEADKNIESLAKNNPVSEDTNLSTSLCKDGSEVTFSCFSGYKQSVMDLTLKLEKLKEFSKDLELQGNIDAIDSVLKRLAADTFTVAIIGEFKRGKSTLINALLGKSILPTDVLPTTATLNKITYGISPLVKLEYKDGRNEEIEIDKLNDYVTKLTAESEQIAKTIKEATVFYPINYCKNGVTIVDTPGLNDDTAMSEVTLSVLPQIDAALMVIMAQSPFSESERDFLESKVITSDLGRILFVVTGIDLLEEDDVERVLNNISARIEEHVMTKAAKTFGKDSPEFETYKRKIGKPRLFGVSAKMALKAKTKNDDAKLVESKFPQFEAALEKFLTEDRGAVMLNVPVNRLKTSSLEIIKAIELHESATNMKLEEFEKKYNQAIEEIDLIRLKRKEEFNQITDNTNKTVNELKPLISEFWPEIIRTAELVLDNETITSEDASKENAEATQSRIIGIIKKETEKTAQNSSEKIQNAINLALTNETERLSGFENVFFNATSNIQNMFTESITVEDKITTTDMIVSSITSSVSGVGAGGAVIGYKVAGWKGMLLGGATGLATVIGVTAIVASLAIPITWPVMLIAGVASVFTSKLAIGAFFKPDKSAEFRKALKENVLKKLEEMGRQEDLKSTVQKQVEMAFEALKTKLETETENILKDTENTLTALKVSKATSSAEMATEKENMEQIKQEIAQIMLYADSMGKQLMTVINK